MRPLTGLRVLLICSSLLPSTALPQRPPARDSTRAILAPPAVQVRQAIVLALVTDSLNPLDPRFRPARAMADSLGFDFDLVLVNHLTVVDRRYNAVYTLPSDVRSGYFIIVPGHRPDVIREYVAPDSLRHRLERYRRFAGPLVAK